MNGVLAVTGLRSFVCLLRMLFSLRILMVGFLGTDEKISQGLLVFISYGSLKSTQSIIFEFYDSFEAGWMAMRLGT